MSWSSSLRFSFSSEMAATAWVTLLSSCETVTRPWTSWERRTIVIFYGKGAGLHIWAEFREVLVAELESTSRLSELPHHELNGMIGRGGS